MFFLLVFSISILSLSRTLSIIHFLCINSLFPFFYLITLLLFQHPQAQVFQYLFLLFSLPSRFFFLFSLVRIFVRIFGRDFANIIATSNRIFQTQVTLFSDHSLVLSPFLLPFLLLPLTSLRYPFPRCRNIVTKHSRVFV